MTALLSLTTQITAALMPVVAPVRGVALRGRRTPLPQGQRAGIRVNAARHLLSPNDLAGVTVLCDSTIVVELLVRADSGDAETALDPYLGAFWAAIKGIAPQPNRSGLTEDVSISIDLDEADQLVAVASAALSVRHITSAADLSG